MEQHAAPLCDELLAFCAAHLEATQTRDGYLELLEVAVIFLGGQPARNIRFMEPGPIHQARWMSKAPYSVKIWLFRDQVMLTARASRGITDMTLFVVLRYLRHFMTSPHAAEAPRHDIALMVSLLDYVAVNKAISEATTTKFSHHLWYLSEELVGLAFLDAEVTPATKRLMVAALDREGENEEAGRAQVDMRTFQERQPESFVSRQAQDFFEKRELPSGFLHADPQTQSLRADYQCASQVVAALAVTNDRAERGVALVQGYNKLLTKNEEQLQFLMQVFEEHRLMYPDSRKSTVMASKTRQQ